jgi:hypothetical protein
MCGTLEYFSLVSFCPVHVPQPWRGLDLHHEHVTGVRLDVESASHGEPTIDYWLPSHVVFHAAHVHFSGADVPGLSAQYIKKAHQRHRSERSP